MAINLVIELLQKFNRDKSGIENIIKYKNKYVGNNSNDSHLIDN